MAKRKLADASINQFMERRGGAHVLSPCPGAVLKSVTGYRKGVTEAGIKEQWPGSNPRLIKELPKWIEYFMPKG